MGAILTQRLLSGCQIAQEVMLQDLLLVVDDQPIAVGSSKVDSFPQDRAVHWLSSFL